MALFLRFVFFSTRPALMAAGWLRGNGLRGWHLPAMADAARGEKEKKIPPLRESRHFLRRLTPHDPLPSPLLPLTPRLQERLLFTICFVAFAWFHQGGGWNQNARFAEIRAMAEQGRFAIDDYLIYQRDPSAPERDRFVRLPLDHAEFRKDGRLLRLAWVDMEWNLFPLDPAAAKSGATDTAMVEHCASGDVGYVPWTGHFHPNKPPGTSFLALPAYWLISHVERLGGVDLDAWWTLTLNSWLTTVFSVGVASALGCVLFFRLARDLANGAQIPAMLATLAFAFGTTFFPFGTILFDHNLTAVLLIAAFYYLRVARKGRRAMACCAVAGFCAGFAAVTNYIAAIAGVFLGLYALLALLPPGRFHWRAAVSFALGVLPPFLLICWYGWACFGSPFQLSTDFQNPLFKVAGGALGMFALPSGYVASLLAVSPFRGVFFLSPVLLLSLYGVVVWLREKAYAAEARLCLAIFVFFFLVNASFNGYHGGFSAGPRYLIPGLPFLALPLVVAFARHRFVTSVLAVISTIQQLLLTATDAQNPLAVGGHARNDQREDFTNHIVAHYAWPLFVQGHAWPMLNQLIALHLEKEAENLRAAGNGEPEVKSQIAELEAALRTGIERGESSPFLLGAVTGPVSVNPIGVFEGLFTFSFYPPGSPQTRWNSFNAGEFIWPESRLSLLPLLVICGGMGVGLVRSMSRRD